MASHSCEPLSEKPAADEFTGPNESTPSAEQRVAEIEPGPRRGPRFWLAGMLALIGLAGGLAFRWWIHARSHVSTDNAFVAASIHQISSRLPGTVTDVFITDNERVAAAAPLVRIDTRDLELRVQQARHQIAHTDAQMAQSAAQLRQATAQQAQAKAKSTKAAAEFHRAHLDFERAQRLTEDGRFTTISKQEYDALKAGQEVAQATADAAGADLESNQALVQAAEATISMVRAQHQLAEVALADAELQLSYASITSPVSGRIGRKAVEVGQRVQPGQSLVAIVSDDKWLVANFKETQLARMQVGQSASIQIDAMPGISFRGHIESFAPASGAQFALLPPDNATGNFTKIVQRVPVKIVLEPTNLCESVEKLVPGLSAFVEVDLESQPKRVRR